MVFPHDFVLFHVVLVVEETFNDLVAIVNFQYFQLHVATVIGNHQPPSVRLDWTQGPCSRRTVARPNSTKTFHLTRPITALSCQLRRSFLLHHHHCPSRPRQNSLVVLGDMLSTVALQGNRLNL